MILLPKTSLIKVRPRLRWHPEALRTFLEEGITRLQTKKGYAGEKSPWWGFIHTAAKGLPDKVQAFIEGRYRFSPMLTYTMSDEHIVIWDYQDRLFVRALLYLLKPVFKHIISPQVFHLDGPSGVRQAIAHVRKGLEWSTFRYFLRIDIKSYYASINHQILLSQIRAHFKDPRIQSYLQDIITVPHLQEGEVKIPIQGVARRSSLSPLFGALYLSPLDNHFSKAPGTLYSRFGDDIVILTQTKRQYVQAKKKLKQILSSLKLEYSRKKTKRCSPGRAKRRRIDAGSRRIFCETSL